MACPCCDTLYELPPPMLGDVERQIRTYAIDYKHLQSQVDLPGLYCTNSDCAEGMVEESAWDDVARIKAELKAEFLGVMTPERIREVRTDLNLSQRRAGQIFGGGPNAFQKYETGKVTISQPMNNLLRLVSKYPELMVELQR